MISTEKDKLEKLKKENEELKTKLEETVSTIQLQNRMMIDLLKVLYWVSSLRDGTN